MVKTQVVSFQLYVASRHVSLQLVEQHFKMLDFHNRWHSWFYSFFKKKKQRKKTLYSFIINQEFWTCKEVLLQ